MRYYNRLKNRGGEKEFITEKGAVLLMCTPEFNISDDIIPENLKEKGLQLRYVPDAYTIWRNPESNKIQLKRIGESDCALPAKRADCIYTPVPSLTILGYALCIDEKLGQVSSEEQKEISKIKEHFKKLTADDQFSSVVHEVHHLQNAVKLDELHEKHNARMTKEQFIVSKFIDEFSASSAEVFSENNLEGEKEMTEATLRVQKKWIANPYSVKYYKEGGDFDSLWNKYLEENKHLPEAKDNALFNDVAAAYFSFEVNGKLISLSAAIDKDILQQGLAERKQSSFSENKPSHLQNGGRD